MGEIVNEQRSQTALVEKFVGTAYDKMLELYNNLPALLTLQAEIAELNNTWLGSLTEEPSVRADGTALLDGDRYFNSNSKSVFVYNNGVWRNTNSVSTTIETFTIAAPNLVGADTVITLSGAYTPNTGNLLVFTGGVYQTPVVHYEETDSHTITFVGDLLEIGETVSVVIGSALTTINPLISVIAGVYITETEDQTVIPLPNGMIYSPGISNLDVYVNGALLILDLDYTETSVNSVTLSDPLPSGTVVYFKQGLLIGNVEVESEVNNLALLNAFNANESLLNTGKPTLVRGGFTVGDTNGGLYFYSPSYQKSLANGVTVIDAGKASNAQGTGTGYGCWLKQYEFEIQPAWFNTPYRGMACLKTVKGVPGDKINLIGFHEGSYVGGGVFVWDATRPATDHDGGTVISPLNTSTPGTAGWFVAPLSGTGCWVRQITTQPSVDWFGVYESAVTDSYNGFEAASNYALPCEIPVRTYTLSLPVSGTFYAFGVPTINGTLNTITNLLA